MSADIILFGHMLQTGLHLFVAAQVYDAAGIDEVGYIGSHLNPWVILQFYPRIKSERILKDIRPPSLP